MKLTLAFIILILITTTSSARTINVPGDYSSIQTAINSANPGDTIVVTGTHYENIIVNKQLTLSSNNAILDGNGGVPVTLDADGVSISGFTIKNSGYGQTDAGIIVKSSYNHILSNKIVDNNNGIFLYHTSDSTTISKNTFTNNNIGIYVFASNDNEITDNTINSKIEGLYMTSSARNNIKDNTISSAGDGVFCYSCSGIKIRSNIISNCKTGISARSSNSFDIRENTIEDNNIGIKFLYSTYSTIYGNTFNNQNNFEISSSTNNGWDGNTWLKPDGTGFSQTCTDSDGNGVCDSPYQLDSDNVDRSPVAVGGIVRPIATINVVGVGVASLGIGLVVLRFLLR